MMSYSFISMSQIYDLAISGSSGSVDSASYALSSSYSLNSLSSSYSLNALSSSYSFTSSYSSYALTSSYSTKPTVIAFACSDETTQIASGSALGTFYMPYSLTVSNIKASLTISGSESSSVDVLKNGTTVFAAPMIISASYYTASRVPTAIDFNSGDRIQVDLNTAGTSAAGLKIYILGN